MPTLTITPTTYYLSNSSYLSVSNGNNMYTDCSSNTYATITNSRTSTTAYYIYIRGFDLSQIPNDAIIDNVAVRVKARHSGGSAQVIHLYDGTSTSLGSSSTTLSTTTTTHEINVNADWSDLVAAGSDLGLRVNCRRSSRNTTSYVYIYGAEIEVTYTIPIYHSVTLTNNTSATVTVSNTSPLEGSNVVVTTNTLSDITITDNNTDVTNQFVQGVSNSITAYPSSYEIDGSINGTHYTQCLGQGLNNTVSGNDYSSSSGSTAYIDYSFDFSQVPAGATIQNVNVKVKGHCEDTSSSSEVATLQLYSGSTTKGNEEEFTSTSDQTITMTPGTWTVSELQNAILRFTIGYYGGAISGVEWTVTYEIEGWTYTISAITTDHVIIVSQASTTKLYIKQNNNWITVTKAYQKINGSWVEKSLDNVFDQTKKYRRV